MYFPVRFFLLYALLAAAPTWATSRPLTPAADSLIPSRAARLHAFEKADLLSETSEMDELDQDLLYMRAKRDQAPGLSASYPALPEEKLRKLKSLVKEQK